MATAESQTQTPTLSGPPRFNAASATDIGRRRTQNQDSLAFCPELGLFVVADGMGGHQGGETASAMAVEIIPEELKKFRQYANWEPHEAITRAIRAANDAIFDRATQNSTLRGMGTTVTALLFAGDRLVIGHVGDSRGYFFRPIPPDYAVSDEAERYPIWQATRDHSLVQEKLRAGLITRAQMRTDRMKNVITRSVGFDKNLNVETYELQVKPGDAFLICSDGLSGQMQDLEIRQVIDEHLHKNHDAEAAVKKLIEIANKNGGDDNITSILVEVVSLPGEPNTV
ncbi:MAG: Stp1/IreP family PP2C-type Ser/Thr phosphatase [Oligoflexia bacterium]|nr:Stp1/IreP family PP2C-type Ser/Thr phosphatase [Oligoflexia bacterium]